jgi:hypothetical protein
LPDQDKEVTIPVPVSIDRLLKIEHRLTRLEVMAALATGIGIASLYGIIQLIIALAGGKPL